MKFFTYRFLRDVASTSRKVFKKNKNMLNIIMRIFATCDISLTYFSLSNIIFARLLNREV